MRNFRLFPSLVVAFSALAVAYPAVALAGDPVPPPAAPAATEPATAKPSTDDPQAIHTASGLVYRDVVVGTGAVATKGATVRVHYTGRLDNGSVFDTSLRREPLEFPLGKGQVIKGWEEGVAGMKVGGVRTLVIPSKLGYGSSGSGPIPPNATLHFDVELVSVDGDENGRAPKVQLKAPDESEAAKPKEVEAKPAADPLLLPTDVAATIGSDDDGKLPGATGQLTQKFGAGFEEARGDYRLRTLPPLWIEHTRGVGTAHEDTQGLYGLLYYRRRAEKKATDAVFPLFFRSREDDSSLVVAGPLVHRETKDAHDNWLAPLYFEGARKDGGYFHAPLLLTTSHWNKESAFTLVGPYFRDRNGTDIDWGIAPFVFHGDNGDTFGGRKSYTVVPPALYYHTENEAEEHRLTVVGPVISEETKDRKIFDVAPFFFDIRGKKKDEHYTTVFPLFHYGHSEDTTTIVAPGVFHRKSPTATTTITPFFSFGTAQRGAIHYTAAGPILPLFFRYRDDDLDYTSTALFPFFFHSSSPRHDALWTPLFFRQNDYGEKKSYWAFPTITGSTDKTGWSFNIHPLVYTGRNEKSTHAVITPLFWDFNSPESRTTIGFPLYWRFADKVEGTTTQVAANTVYHAKRVKGGIDWQFHVLPIFSYGEDPDGYFWNVAFGLAGYSRHGEYGTARALWIPIPVHRPAASAPAAVGGFEPGAHF